jgi:predicted TIM-barrel fold metal-dependent hydrolase
MAEHVAKEELFMPDPLIFDCWASYGPHPGKDEAERWRLDHLLEDMDFYGLAGALVRHEQSAYYDAMYCNRRLVKEIAPYRDRLYPCWAVLPHQSGDFPDLQSLAEQMRQEDIRAVHLQPARNAYPIHADVLRPLAEELTNHRCLIAVTLTDLGTNYQSAVDFCRIFNRCPVLIAESHWSQWRLMTAIMDACSNAHMELHNFQGNRALEWFSQRYGIKRLLFGSGLLKRSAGAARGYVDWTLLQEKEISAFAGGNLKSLLGQGPSSVPRLSEDADETIQCARSGRPLSVTVLDAHSHVLHDGLNGAGAAYPMPGGDAEHMLELNRRMGVTAAAMMSWNGTVSMDVVDGNKLIEELVQRYPKEIIGVSCCDPTHQTAAEIEETCRHLHQRRGFRGLKPYYTNNLSYADPRYKPYWDFCNQHGLYALLHVAPAAGGLQAVKELAERYPEAIFIIAHTGQSWVFAREAAAIIRTYPNVMAELTYTGIPNGLIEWLCSAIGAGRLLFGSDAPMRDPRPQLGWCVYTRLSATEKKQMLGGNFAGILRRGELSKCPLPI